MARRTKSEMKKKREKESFNWNKINIFLCQIESSHSGLASGIAILPSRQECQDDEIDNFQEEARLKFD